MRKIEPSSPVWRFTMAFTGVGSTMLGPFLPDISRYWRLQDHQAGLLVACLFFGSFSGTMLLSRRLERSLQHGSWAACTGCLLFAWFTQRSWGFVGGGIALVIMGFGMGQLMGSINLLVGAAPETQRLKVLAHLGGAWCMGAILSPCLTTILSARISPSQRLGLFAPLYLLPIVAASRSQRSRVHTRQPEKTENVSSDPRSRVAVMHMIVFLVYGGIEASIGGWFPLFATRYSTISLGSAQWMISLFWLGLIVGRVLTARFVSHAEESSILRMAITSSACFLLWLDLFPSSLSFVVGSAVMGTCLSPVFPLLLSAAIACGLTTRVMAMVLAACALGSAALPLLLGVLSGFTSLQAAMLLPFIGLIILLLLQTYAWTHQDRIRM